MYGYVVIWNKAYYYYCNNKMKNDYNTILKYIAK